MNSSTAQYNEEVTKWDVALAALAREEFLQAGAALTLDDFRRIAKHYAIRLDDIMVTMFEMAIAGEWIYQYAAGQDQVMERESLDELYVNGRLHDKDLQVFTGNWRPAH